MERLFIIADFYIYCRRFLGIMAEIMDYAEAASLAVIANKQDLPNSLAPSVVRKVFNQVVHPLVATDLTQHGVAELVLEQSLISHTELMTQE